MRQTLEAHVRGPMPSIETIEARLGALSAGATAQLRGEMDRQAGAAPGAAQRRPSRRRATQGEP
jgi:hypothetical protein